MNSNLANPSGSISPQAIAALKNVLDDLKAEVRITQARGLETRSFRLKFRPSRC